MRRREFITVLGGAMAVWPLAARAQQPRKLPTIGVLGSDAAIWRPWMDAFGQRLRELGWIEGRTILIEYRWADARPERAAEIAAEFVGLNVDVILTAGPNTVIAKQATSVIPIVFAITNDPVGGGLVASLAQPGGNVTGLSLQATDLSGKRVEFLRELVPQLRRLAVIGNVGWRDAVLEMASVVPQLAHSVSKSCRSKFGERRTSPPLRRSIRKPTRFMSWPMLSLPPIARASSRWRSLRGCR